MSRPVTGVRWFRAHEEEDTFGLRPGDLVRYDPTVSPAIRIIRYPVQDHRAFWTAVESGILTQLPEESPAARADVHLTLVN